MTAPTQLTATLTELVPACDVCSHTDAEHDAIARRWCNATMTKALSRNCICPPALKLSRQHSYGR